MVIFSKDLPGWVNGKEDPSPAMVVIDRRHVGYLNIDPVLIQLNVITERAKHMRTVSLDQYRHDLNQMV